MKRTNIDHIQETEQEEVLLNWMASLPSKGKLVDGALLQIKAEDKTGKELPGSDIVREVKEKLLDFMEKEGMDLETFEEVFKRIKEDAEQRKNVN